MSNSKQTSWFFRPNIFYEFYFIRICLYRAISASDYSMTGTMMDFGCGSKPYKSLFTVNDYIGLDFEGESHSHEKEQIDVFYDGRILPFPNEKT